MSDHGYPDTTTFPRPERGTASAVVERQRISKAVRGLPIVGSDLTYPDNPNGPWFVNLDAVLEIIDGRP